MYIMIGMAIYSILGAVAVLNEIAYSTRTTWKTINNRKLSGKFQTNKISIRFLFVI